LISGEEGQWEKTTAAGRKSFAGEHGGEALAIIVCQPDGFIRASQSPASPAPHLHD